MGLVKTLADVVSDHGGNWERSHLAELAGTFAGIVMVTVPDRRADELSAALAPLDGLLDISVRSASSDSSKSTTSGAQTRQMLLELVGNDRPGIVAAVSGILAEHGFGVADLQTSTREAPMAGGVLFEATAVVTVAADVSPDGLREALEDLASEILVDLSVIELD